MLKEYTILHLFCGSGGAALGFAHAVNDFKGMVGRFRTLGGIDCDRDACADFQALTGYPAYEMDLFTRQDYTAFHGQKPPNDWREVTPEDIFIAAGREYPDVVFLSPPCKGLSGLLPAESAASPKYQALNRLVIRGLELVIGAFSDDLPSVIMLENVPRITTRGAFLLKQMKNLLGRHGYVFHEGYHDCGELGGLGEHRKRYLLIARNRQKMPSVIYNPAKQRVKAIGEVIGPLAFPNDPALGVMHRLPNLQFKTWVRLAMIAAGGDWRDLEQIAPEQYRLEYIPRGGGAYGVQDWNCPGATVIGNSYVKGSNSVSLADPRVDWDLVYQLFDAPGNGLMPPDPRMNERDSHHPAVYQIVRWDEPGPCVTGTRFGSGAPGIADPRINDMQDYFKHSYNVRQWDEPAGTVTSGHSPSCGLNTVADPRIGGGFSNKRKVLKWDEPATTITGIPDIQSGAQSISDPRTGFKDGSHRNIYQVDDWNLPSKTVTGALRPNNGAISLNDPRLTCSCRNGLYGVQAWDQPGYTVTGAKSLHSGTSAVADRRVEDEIPPLPADNENGLFLIIALDGTWHRPLTTLECAVIQGLPLYMFNGTRLQLAGKSDSRWRERIGNMVPPPSAQAIGQEILFSLLNTENELRLSGNGVWVMPPLELPEWAFTRVN